MLGPRSSGASGALAHSPIRHSIAPVMSAPFCPCPCCGHLVFSAPPGSEDICMICFWEDDAQQLRFPSLADATNVMSLVEAQQSYAKCGAVDERLASDVRK